MKLLESLIPVVVTGFCAAQALISVPQLGLTDASLFGSALPPGFTAFDGGGGTVPLPPPSTPCISGSCISDGTTYDTWDQWDWGCFLLQNPTGLDYSTLSMSITKYECIPQGYPGYVYSYVCNTSVVQLCADSSSSPAPTCPSGNCTQ